LFHLFILFDTQPCNHLITVLDDNHTKLSGHGTKYKGSLYMLQFHDYCILSVYWHQIIYIVFFHQERSQVAVKRAQGR
jgi:hypothetical protein